MADYIDSDSHRAEVAALNNEIYRLNKRLNDVQQRQLEASVTDPQNPFDNPTEYHGYSDDYSKTLPWIKMPEYKIPLEPARVERKSIKRSYNIGGWCLLFHFLGSNILASLLIIAIKAIISSISGGADSSAIDSYMSESSILSGINLIIYMLANVGFAMLGFKWSKNNFRSIVQPKGYNFAYAIQYCIIAMFIWVATTYLSLGIEQIFDKFGYSTIVSDSSDIGVTGIGYAVMTIYSCIIAPITEEVFYRGMLLKVFSKANQRFAVVATALFFGLAHGNIPQFCLAFFLGIFLAHITLKHSSIVPSMIVHIFVNTFVTLLSLTDSHTTAQSIATMILLAGAILGLCLLLMFRKHDKVPATTPEQSRRGFVIARTSVPVVISFCLEAAYMTMLIFAS